MNPSAETITIQLSKRKIALMILGSLAFVAAAVWLWSRAKGAPFLNPDMLRVIALVSGIFGGICGVYGCIKAADNRPGLVIDGEGIIDNSSGVAAGRIRWDEITGLKISTISGQKFLTLKIKEPQSYRDGANAFARLLHGPAVGMTGSPINISANALDVNFDELHRLMNLAFERHKSQAITSS